MNFIIPYFDAKNLFFSVFSNISPKSHILSAEKFPAGQLIQGVHHDVLCLSNKTKSSQDFTFLDLNEWMEGLER